MDEWFRWALTVPLAALLGLLTVVPPVPRWSMRLKRASSLAQALPPGPERDYFEHESVRAGRLIMEYRTMIPRSEKIFSWVAVGYVLLLIVIVALNPLQAWSTLVLAGPVWWLLIGAAVLLMLPAIVGALTGRTSLGMTPRRYAEYMEEQRSVARRRRVWWQARWRAWRTARRSARWPV